jgi:predicted flap endonuclease-1-like 5' DNA nuclease
VSENDLTVIAGIGPKAAALLRSHGIGTWKDLADTSVEFLRQVLDGEGGPYKGIDPGHWPGQARMAERGEWRKLRAYQDFLRRQDNA